MERELELTHEVYSEELPSALFAREVLQRALPFIQSFRWPTDVKGLSPLTAPHMILQKSSSSEEAVVERGGCLAVVDNSRGFVQGKVAGLRESVISVIDELRNLFPEADRAEALEIPVTFWRASPRGPASSQRRISAQPWEKVAPNYVFMTKEMLDKLMLDFQPGAAGRLLLWHGSPGTGKTHALRSLAWEWRDWCRIEYVIDPEKFLGDSDYLLQVLLHAGEDDDHEDGDELNLDKRWRLIALEDAGELVSSDARDRVGQHLSRLLNTVDGLIGEGLKIMILITTNEPLSRLHPAASRPGRCAAEIEFGRFSSKEARAWLVDAGAAAVSISEASLAELFALAEGSQIRSRPVAVNEGLYL